MKINLPNLIQTPAGSSASAAGVISLLFNVILPPVWPWFANQSTAWRGAVVTIVTFAGTYLGSWIKIVLAHGQKVTMSLTSGALPTLQAEPVLAPVPAAVVPDVTVSPAPPPAAGGDAHAQAGQS